MSIAQSFDMLVAADYLEQTGAEGFREVAEFLREQYAKATKKQAQQEWNKLVEDTLQTIGRGRMRIIQDQIEASREGLLELGRNKGRAKQ